VAADPDAIQHWKSSWTLAPTCHRQPLAQHVTPGASNRTNRGKNAGFSSATIAKSSQVHSRLSKLAGDQTMCCSNCFNSGGRQTAWDETPSPHRVILNSVHSLSHNLHSSTLEFLGLAAATRSLCREFVGGRKSLWTFLKWKFRGLYRTRLRFACSAYCRRPCTT
jgi:hypothetical protein